MQPDFSSEIVISTIVVWIVNWMKSSQAPAMQWISTNTPWVTRATYAAAAALRAAGFTMTYGAGTLTLTGLTLPHIVFFLFIVLKNYVYQHLVASVVAVHANSKAATN